jgi:hypothetical protein
MTTRHGLPMRSAIGLVAWWPGDQKRVYRADPVPVMTMIETN